MRRREERSKEGREEKKDDPGPSRMMILKRPTNTPTTSTSGSKPSNPPDESPSSQSETQKSMSILQRSISGQKKSDSTQDLRSSGTAVGSQAETPTPTPEATKGRTVGPVSTIGQLRPPYKFPEGHAIPIIDNNFKFRSESNFEFLTAAGNNPDFFVITAIGMPQSGKSTLLSFLSDEEGDSFGTRTIFPVRRPDETKMCSIYMNSKNVIFIEMASVFNSSAAVELIKEVVSQGTLETAAMTWNLKLMRWALSVSHVLLVVSENLVDPNLFQLINSAKIIHPLESAFGDGEHPEVLFVCNKAPLSYFDNSEFPSQVEEMFETVTGQAPRVNPIVFLLPHIKSSQYMEYSRFEELRDKINEFSRFNRAPFGPEVEGKQKFPQKITMTEWFNAAARSWDEMNHQSFFSSYVQLLP